MTPILRFTTSIAASALLSVATLTAHAQEPKSYDVQRVTKPLQIDGKLKAAITEGTGKQAGKLLVTFDGTDGEFLMRWSSAKRKTSANIMSSALPIAKAVASATYKVFPDEKAVVIALPDADAPAAPAPAGDATPAVEPELEDLRAY